MSERAKMRRAPIAELEALRAEVAALRQAIAAREGQDGASGDGRHSRPATPEASEARYRELFENSNDILYTLDLRGNLTDINRRGELVTGYAREELLGRPIADIVLAQYHAPMHHVLERKLEGEPVTTYEIELRAKDGRRVLLEVSSRLVYQDGQPAGVQGSARDITERKQAEVALEQARAAAEQTARRERRRARLLRALADVSLEINAAPSLDTTLQVVTDRARNLIGAHQSVTSFTVGGNWAQSITAVSLSDRYAAWRTHAIQPDGSGIYALVCRENRAMRMTQAELEAHPTWHGVSTEAGRHLPMRGWLAVPLVGRDGRNLGLVQLSDKDEGEFTEEDEAVLTQLAQMAAVAIENARLYEEAQRAVRLRNEFLSSVSHDLRSPIAAVKGQAQLLARRAARRDAPDATRLVEGLTAIDNATNRMTHLINELLDVARLQIGQPLDLSTATTDLVSLIRTEAAEQARTTARRIVVDTPLTELVGMWDANRLRRVVANLLSNAIKYSPEGSPITVTIGRGTRDVGRGTGSSAEMSKPAPSPEERAWFSVRDEGVGIPAADLPHVFDRFHRGANVTGRVEGSGIGLAGARQIVEQHGGAITAESVEGEGSTFTVWLPLSGE